MRRGRRGLAGRALALALTAGALPAWTDTQEEAINLLLHARLAASYGASQTLTGKGEFLILANPGIAIGPEQLRDPYDLCVLLDKVPRPEKLYQPSGLSYSTAYQNVLQAAETSRYQVMADRDRALEALNLIQDKRRPGKPTAEYADYLKYEAEHVAALDAKSLAATEHQATGKAIPPGLDQAIRTAEENWSRKGHREAMEAAFAARKRLYETSTGVMFQMLRSHLSAARQYGGHAQPWLPVTANPPMDRWMWDLGWRKFRFGTSTTAVQQPRGTQSGVPGISLMAELKRVAIQRPWLDRQIFSLRTWRFPASSAIRMVSSGRLADRDPGTIPVLVTGVLLARKLSITADDGNLPGRVGPFTLDPAAGPSAARTTRSMEGTHIIAFFCEAVPRCPDPDPKFFK